LTNEDVPGLVTKTRDLMLKTLLEISSVPGQTEASTTPLLAGQQGRSSYTEDSEREEEEAEEVLEGSVVGVTATDTSERSKTEGRKYAIA
jgi:hypothetical protein